MYGLRLMKWDLYDSSNSTLSNTWIFCRNMVVPEDSDLPLPPYPVDYLSRVPRCCPEWTHYQWRVCIFCRNFPLRSPWCVVPLDKQSGLKFTKKEELNLIQNPKKRTWRSSFHNTTWSVSLSRIFVMYGVYCVIPFILDFSIRRVWNQCVGWEIL